MRWLKEAASLRAARGPTYRGGRYLLNADGKDWERVRNQARLAAYKCLPGAEDELSKEAGKTCKMNWINNSEQQREQDRDA